MIRIFIFFIHLIILGQSDIHPDYHISQVPIIKIGVVSDVQYCDCEDTETRFFRGSLEKLREAIADFNNEELDFVISLGDLIDRDFQSFSKVLPILDSSEAKVYHVLGNHDFDMNPRDRKKVFSELDSGKGFYSFDIEGFRFIVVNSNDLSTYSIKSKNRNDALKLIETINQNGEEHGFDWNGGLSRKQIDWLHAELSDANSKGSKVIVFSHHTLWPASRYNILNYKELTQVLDKNKNVIAWFCGHNHRGGYGNYNFIHCVNFKGMVDTKETNAYSVVEIYQNKIWIKGRGREREQILAY